MFDVIYISFKIHFTKHFKSMREFFSLILLNEIIIIKKPFLGVAYQNPQTSLEGVPRFYQTLHLDSGLGFIFEPAGHFQSAENSTIFDMGP